MMTHSNALTRAQKAAYTLRLHYGDDYFTKLAYKMVEKYGRQHMRDIGARGGEAYNRRYVAGGLGGPVLDRKQQPQSQLLPY